MEKLELLSHWGEYVEFTMSKRNLQTLRSLLVSGQSAKPVKIGVYYFYFTGVTLGYNSTSNLETILRYTLDEDATTMVQKIDTLLTKV
ncbi:hypothetical protein QFZ84_004849 [Pseudomonas fluorescens]